MNSKERFGSKADKYKKFRPTYPKAVIDYLYSIVGFSEESNIADIGSGTGIFSRLLLERGSQVYCVEPNNEMRHIAENDLSKFNNFHTINAAAENTKLEDKSMDFITVATAFHWFDRQAFKAECHRILANNGKVVLIWNLRDVNAEFVNKEHKIRLDYFIGRKSARVNTGEPEDCVNFFANDMYELTTFINSTLVDRETYIGINLSSSYAPSEDDSPRYYEFVSELGKLFDVYSVDGILTYPFLTNCYTGVV